jgi:hypothetical protein
MGAYEMRTDCGEFIVGAYLKIILKCGFVDYNVRTPDGGLEGLNELDVIGLDFAKDTAYLCEVTTHLHGTRNPNFIQKIRQKHKFQKRYAKRYLGSFGTKKFMYWSPIVPVGEKTSGLSRMKSLELVINTDYTQCIEQLREQAQCTKRDAGNPFFRYLQILEQLR